ncbi:hypothetical protein GCM10027447_07560 [Glycomyces halotolerans]
MDPETGKVLTALARRALETSFDGSPPLAAELIDESTPKALLPRLAAPAATFVTLEGGSRLRGCIGTLKPLRPLSVDVVHNARAAARDPRLPPVERHELPGLSVTVAVLSPPRRIGVDSFTALFEQLRPGTDGLTLVGRDRRRATFLPSVWKALREPERFVAALLRKGGWPRALWTADLRRAVWPADLAAERYTARSFTAPPAA